MNITCKLIDKLFSRINKTETNYKFCDVDTVRNLTVIHYGRKHFWPILFDPISNINFNKPYGGLWTSPIDSNYGWIDWNKDSKWVFCEPSVSFKLRFRDDAKILVIDSAEDLKGLPTYKFTPKLFKTQEYLDFRSLSKVCDALWLTEKGLRETKSSHPISFEGWDCETVLIMNKKCCYQWRH